MITTKNKKSHLIHTPLGSMIAIADTHILYLLEFLDRQRLESEVARFCQKTKSTVISGRTPPITSIETELQQYFSGNLKKFKTPLTLLGTPFQNRVWQELQKIPYGETRTYAEIAKAIAKPTAFRAVAQANGANQLAIIIPCHRVINSNGLLGGYSSGIERKEGLLAHEKNI